MFRINALSNKGTRFRFRIQSGSVDDLQAMLDKIFAGRNMRMVLVEPIQ